MLLSGSGSRASMVALSAALGFYRSLKRLSGLPEMTFSRTAPHPDTAYKFLQQLPPAELEALLSNLVKPLLRQHLWDDARFDGEWLVAVDATWIRSFDHAHCPHCLTQHHSSGQMTYAHAVLEAKLLISPTLAVPLASVPIANENPDATKQDCELTAWPRLAQLLKQRHPRRPICLTMDSLYAVGPVIDLCAEYGWSYVAVIKEGRAPAFYPQALAAAHRHPGTTVDLPAGGRQEFTWACNQDYNGRTVHFVHCVETRPDLKTPSVWGWITDRRPDVKMAPLLGNHGGRPRWTIEETFRQLKHGASEQQHDFGSQGHAWYNTWLLAQLACLLLQLLDTSDVLRLASDGAATRLRQVYRTLRNFALALLIAALTEADAIVDPPATGRVHFFVSGP